MTNADHRPPWPLPKIEFSLDDQGVCHAIEPASALDGTAGVIPARESYVPPVAAPPAMASAAPHMMPLKGVWAGPEPGKSAHGCPPRLGTEFTGKLKMAP